MSLRLEMRWTILVQGLGAIATTLTVIAIGLSEGVAAQGEFSRLKSSIELLTAIAMLGIPQGLFYFQRKKLISKEQIVLFATITFLLGIVVSVIYSLIYELFQSTHAFYLALTVATAATCGIFRSEILATLSSRTFNAITALPQVLLLATAAGVITLKIYPESEPITIFLLPWIASFGVSILISISIKIPTPKKMASTPELIRYSLSSWLPIILSTGAFAYWLQYIKNTSDLKTTGLFAMGMVGTQIILTPINYSTPLLFKHWIDSNRIIPSTKTAITATLLATSLLTLASIIEFAPWPSITKEYWPLFAVAEYFMIIALCEGAIRLIYVANNARGMPWSAVISETIRVITLILGSIFFNQSSLENITKLWTAGSLMALLASSFIYYKNTNFD